MNDFGKDFWSARWQNGETQWDQGTASRPMKEFIDTLENKTLKILIPGCGNGYEAEYLYAQGFQNVFLVDFAEQALQQFAERVPGFPKAHLLCADFFELEEGNFDLVLEQTFFSAIHPGLREKYAQKMFSLLKPGGKLVGLLFNDPKLDKENPPFGGNVEEYRAIFSPYFAFHKFEAAYNSIAPRAGRELFIHLLRLENKQHA